MAERYDLLYLDPPWKFGARNNVKTRFGGGAGFHYPCMSVKELCAMPMADMMNDRCLVFMWGSFAKMAELNAVLKAWGNLKLVTIGFLWVKVNKGGRVIEVPKNHAIDSHGKLTKKKSVILDGGIQFGTGYYAKSNAEPCWLARRGRTYKPATDKVSSIVFAPHTGVHSEKPAEVRDRISLMYPDLNKAEIFARHSATLPRWTAIGNQVGLLDGPATLEMEEGS